VSELRSEAEEYCDIDWFHEPRSEREAKIRGALLRHQVANLNENPFQAAIRLREEIGYRSSEIDKCAADFRAAWAAVEKECQGLRRSARLRQIEKAIREIDQS
jgi:hypothetical protein